MVKKLVIGCGRHHHNEFESSPNLHPYPDFDSLDIDPQVQPSMLGNIDNTQWVRTTLPAKTYDLMMFERFPAEAITRDTFKNTEYY